MLYIDSLLSSRLQYLHFLYDTHQTIGTCRRPEPAGFCTIQQKPEPAESRPAALDSLKIIFIHKITNQQKLINDDFCFV